MESICEQDDPLEEESKEEVMSTDESFESQSADSDFDMEEEEMPQKRMKRMPSYSKPVTRRSARILAEAKSKQQSTKIRIKIPPKNDPSPVKMTNEEAAQILVTLKVCFLGLL